MLLGLTGSLFTLVIKKKVSSSEFPTRAVRDRHLARPTTHDYQLPSWSWMPGGIEGPAPQVPRFRGRGKTLTSIGGTPVALICDKRLNCPVRETPTRHSSVQMTVNLNICLSVTSSSIFSSIREHS